MLRPERNFLRLVMLSASAFSKYPRMSSYDCMATMFAPLASSSRSSANLQVMRPRVITAGEESHRLQAPRVGRIQNRHAVAEHVSDIKVAGGSA